MDEELEVKEEETEEVEEKAHLIGMEGPPVPFGITSFADYDAMVQAEELTGEMKSLTHAFAEMAENIFMNSEVEDKAVALDTLASEFASRVGSVSTKDKGLFSEEELREAYHRAYGDRDPEEVMRELIEEQLRDEKAVWSTAFINDLPDSSFLHVESGGTKENGKTTPRSKRHLPYKNAQGNVDLPHLRNAISRLGQSATGSGGWLTESLRTRLQAKARRILASETKEKSLLDKAIGALKSVFEPEEEKQDSNFLIWKEVDGTYRWFAIFSNNYRDNDNPPEILAAQAHEGFVKAVDSGEYPYPELWHWHIPGTRWGISDWLAYDGSFAMASGTVDKGYEEMAEAVAILADNLGVSHGMPIKEIERDDEDPTIITRYRSKEISVLPSEAAANLHTGFSVLDKEANMPIPKDKEEFLRNVGVSDEGIKQINAELSEGKNKADEEGLESKEETSEPSTTEPEPDTTPVSRSEVAELTRAIGEGLQQLNTQVEALAGEIKELKEKEDEPSLADIFQSAVGTQAAKQDGREALAKSKPRETDTKEEDIINSGNLMMNDLVNGLITGDAWKNFPGTEEVSQ